MTPDRLKPGSARLGDVCSAFLASRSHHHLELYFYPNPHLHSTPTPFSSQSPSLSQPHHRISMSVSDQIIWYQVTTSTSTQSTSILLPCAPFQPQLISICNTDYILPKLHSHYEPSPNPHAKIYYQPHPSPLVKLKSTVIFPSAPAPSSVSITY